MMRKTLLLSALAAGVFGIVAVAFAANTYKVDIAKVTPTKSGTLLHPKPERIQFGYSVSTTDGNRPATSTDQQVGFGTGLKQNSKLKATATKFAFAQCKRSQASANACPTSTKVGSGVIKNFAGLQADRTQKIPCLLTLTIFNGDGKLFPPAQNDGRSVREDVWLQLKGGPPSCPLVVNAPIPAQFVPFKGGQSLKFHISQVPFQEPQTGVENSVVNVTASLFKTARVKGKTRGFFESTACPKGGRPFVVTFTDSSGAKSTASKKAPCTK
jgi:hypothetical protein